MSHFHCKLLFAAAIVASVAEARAGSFPPAAGFPGATAISATSASIAEWASGYSINRGLVQIDDASQGYATYGGTDGTTTNSAPVGPPPQPQTQTYGIALGQGGTCTVTFAQPLTNGAGADFAVFGNGFVTSGSTSSWIKPAFVEVSSDGVNFFAFPSVSLTPTTTQVGDFGTLNPTNLYDLAGKDPFGWGTPFDLSELAGVSPLLDVNDVTAVRMVDCVDDINPAYASYDSQGHIVNGPWKAFSSAGSEGFVLAGVGAINVVPEPQSLVLVAVAGAGFVWLRRARRGVTP
jgi:hypothetical protein